MLGGKINSEVWKILKDRDTMLSVMGIRNGEGDGQRVGHKSKLIFTKEKGEESYLCLKAGRR